MAFVFCKLICSRLLLDHGPDGGVLSVDPYQLEGRDIHINIKGQGGFISGLGLVVALLALVMGKAVDPKACFIGVSVIVAACCLMRACERDCGLTWILLSVCDVHIYHYPTAGAYSDETGTVCKSSGG